jgi:hypothetical protein
MIDHTPAGERGLRHSGQNMARRGDLVSPVFRFSAPTAQRRGFDAPQLPLFRKTAGARSCRRLHIFAHCRQLRLRCSIQPTPRYGFRDKFLKRKGSQSRSLLVAETQTSGLIFAAFCDFAMVKIQNLRRLNNRLRPLRRRLLRLPRVMTTRLRSA